MRTPSGYFIHDCVCFCALRVSAKGSIPKYETCVAYNTVGFGVSTDICMASMQCPRTHLWRGGSSSVVTTALHMTRPAGPRDAFESNLLLATQWRRNGILCRKLMRGMRFERWQLPTCILESDTINSTANIHRIVIFEYKTNELTNIDHQTLNKMCM